MTLMPIMQYNRAAYLLGQLSYETQAPASVDQAERLEFKPDGTRVFTQYADDIAYYDLSVAWDVSSAGNEIEGLEANLPSANAAGIQFNDDGTVLFSAVSDQNPATGTKPGIIKQSGVSPAYGGSGSSVVTQQHDKIAPTDNLRHFEIVDNGKRIIILDDEKFYESTMSTPYDLSTANAWSSVRLDLSATYGELASFTFGRNNLQLIVIERAVSSYVHEYLLTTPLDVSTAVLVNTYDPAFRPSKARGVTFGKRGEKFYLVGDEVYQYSAVR